MPRRSLFSLFAVCISLCLFGSVGVEQEAAGQTTKTVTPSAESDLMVRVSRKNRSILGKPLIWDGKQMQVLRRDGRMSLVSVASHEDYEILKTPFSPYSRETIINRLKLEFGDRYQISSTPNFLVVHPIGDYHTWAQPFEDLYVRFAAWFQTRGVILDKPEFPMVAVVLRTRREFDRMLKSWHRDSYDPATLGYYSPRSNRVITYAQDQNGNGTGAAKSLFSNGTLIHEAAHQTAYNRGIHSRYVASPRWMSEGLACLFEAEGVNNSFIYTRQKDRINKSRLASMLRYIDSQKATGKLESLIRDDSLFRSDGDLAYAYAWALTFYLAETQTRKWTKFLTDDAAREDFSSLQGSDRIEHFAAAFGSDLENFEATMFRYLKKAGSQR